MPIAKLSLKEIKSTNRPWLTKGILKSISQKKCYLQKIYQSQKSPF